VPRYKLAVTAQLTAPVGVDELRLGEAIGGSATVLAPDIFRVVLTRRGRDADCAANHALIDVNRALGPTASFARPPAWSARQLGPFGLRRRTAGRWHIDGGDDGLGGVREPRRPLPPAGSASAALDPPS
jgi:hypothetical protein